MSKKPPSKTSLWNILSQTSDDKKTAEPRVYTKNFRTPQKFGPASQVRNVKLQTSIEGITVEPNLHQKRKPKA
jgi:hypothetical protein